LTLTPASVCGIGINYPRPKTIGPDRLANAVAARHHYGAPSVVVDFGTAVTFDVVDRRGDYVGGIIAPGLAAMTDYLHEKTALLPKIKVREVGAVIGKNTEAPRLTSGTAAQPERRSPTRRGFTLCRSPPDRESARMPCLPNWKRECARFDLSARAAD
jgi:hypothetical protein